MKAPKFLLIVALIFFETSSWAQGGAISENQPMIWIKQTDKSNKKYIREFDTNKKATQINWLIQPSQVEIKKGLYRIRFTHEGLLLADQITIRKVHTDQDSKKEVRTLLPAGYYRIEYPQPKTMEVYFSEGANHFFSADPGYLLISGMMQKNNLPIPDMIIGSTPYLAQLEKKKRKQLTLLAIR
jgi:hypothetical protein